jgi:hypothetical protein
MSKRKVGPMRPKTKEAMVRLAEIMVQNYKLEVIKGTPEFLEYAIHEAEENDLGISWQTIKLREQFLEMRCDELYKDIKANTLVEELEEDIDDADIVFYDEQGFEVDDTMIISIALAKIKRMMSMIKAPKIVQPTKNYNMFYTDHNGSLCWAHGKLTNAVVGSPALGYYNNANRWVSEKGHAIWLTSNDNPKFKDHNFTKDDLEILQKVSTSTYE